MKHPKRFCVKCNKLQYLVINGSTIPMYYCRKCGESVCRVGDGEPNKQSNLVKNDLDFRIISDDCIDKQYLVTFAKENPEILSDNHTLWPKEDDEHTFQRKLMLNRFKTEYKNLTPRQKEIVEAVVKFGTHFQAALELGVSRSLVTNTIKRIEEKLRRNIFNKSR